MSRRSTKSLNLNRRLALQTKPALERIAEDFQQSLAHLEKLHKEFRRNFLKLFEESPNHDGPIQSDEPARRALDNIYFFTQANLAGNTLAHLEYVADMIDLATGLLERAAGLLERAAGPEQP